jgi:hypothetical protein
MTENRLPNARRRLLRGDNALLGAAVAACAVCCAGPLLALLTAIGMTSAVLAVAVPAFAIVAAVSALAVVWLRRRSRSRRPAPGRVTDLQLTTVRPTDSAPPDPAVPRDDAPFRAQPPAR